MSSAAIRKLFQLIEARFSDFTVDESPVTLYTCLMHRCPNDAGRWMSEPLDPGVSLAELMRRAIRHLEEENGLPKS